MSDTSPGAVPLAWRVLLEETFRACAEAGFGRIDQDAAQAGVFHFEAYPGMEDAAADYVDQRLQELDR